LLFFKLFYFVTLSEKNILFEFQKVVIINRDNELKFEMN